MWRDVKISKDMHVSSQDTALAYDSPLFRKSLSARLLTKSLHFFPIPPFVPKTARGVAGGGGEEEERSHSHDHNSLLVLPFLLFAPRRWILWICSGFTLSSGA